MVFSLILDSVFIGGSVINIGNIGGVRDYCVK